MAKDINRLPDDGYIVFPLSMSLLNTRQSPEQCMKFLSVLDKKLNLPTNDVVFLYTNGLYFNSDEKAGQLRKRTNSQMLSHKGHLKRLILKKKTYFPSAFHFLPFDYVILNSDSFENFFNLLKQAYKKDKKFKDLVFEGLGNRTKNEENVNFILEEIAVAHIIREQLVEFPKSLVKKDAYRLVMYPGRVLRAEAYMWKHKILPRGNPKRLGRYFNATYDPEQRVIHTFDEINV